MIGKAGGFKTRRRCGLKKTNCIRPFSWKYKTIGRKIDMTREKQFTGSL